MHLCNSLGHAVAELLSHLLSQQPISLAGVHSFVATWLLSLRWSQQPISLAEVHSSAVTWPLSLRWSQQPISLAEVHSSAVTWPLSLRWSQQPISLAEVHSSAVTWPLSLRWSQQPISLRAWLIDVYGSIRNYTVICGVTCAKLDSNRYSARRTVDNIGASVSMDNWGERSEPCTSEVNANSVCMSSTDRPQCQLCLYVCHRPTGRIAHAQKHAKHMYRAIVKHMLVSASHCNTQYWCTFGSVKNV